MTRQFDPVLSAALRNELESLAGRPEAAPAPRPPLLRPQVWVSVVTAIVLVLATVGVLRLTTPAAQPAHPAPRVADPLSLVTDPTAAPYVARAVHVLLHARGTGAGTQSFDVPASVPSMSVYLTCAPSGHFATRIDGKGMASGGCDQSAGSSFALPVKAGSHELTVTVPRRTAWALLVIATPGPTVSAGPLVDPLRQVRDRFDPDAVVGDTRPVLRLQGRAAAPAREVAVPQQRLRVYLVCRPSSTGTSATVDGHRIVGCMNSIAHWFDLTPSSARIPVRVDADGAEDWSLLVIRAPEGAKDSPANTTLPYPKADGTVVGRARGAGGVATGRFRPGKQGWTLQTTCRGTGWVELRLSDGSGVGRGDGCGSGPSGGSFGNVDRIGLDARGRLGFTVIPHGDVSWTAQFLPLD